MGRYTFFSVPIVVVVQEQEKAKEYNVFHILSTHLDCMKSKFGEWYGYAE
jgi:hypothetical protein